MELITDMRVLMQKTTAVTFAKKYGTPDDVKNAEKDLSGYRKLCSCSDKISIGMSCGALSDTLKGIGS